VAKVLNVLKSRACEGLGFRLERHIKFQNSKTLKVFPFYN